ncbi:sphingomyelin phosphodiesterase [Schizopora paradoxa]|uniref:Sphingomyelin phosphodiesterase n=1 Tax=Schizopora paradoxa TaxID=27342 RepID=A0A0H2RR04_9AGAM|nr:sphingomyelin phosphodiesterase [Schizopora paradoxa]
MAQESSERPSAFAAPGNFPTSLFASYYNDPTQTTAQVQPIITDPVLNIRYPLDLTDPDTIPDANNEDPHPVPPRASDDKILSQLISQIKAIARPETFNSPFAGNPCAQCQAALIALKAIALVVPDLGHLGTEALCNAFSLSSDCSDVFGPHDMGPLIIQMIANSNTAGYDGQAFCSKYLGMCPPPPTPELNLTGWFKSPKPDPSPSPKAPSGERLKVLHLSDFHIDPRYKTGAEAECSRGFCCRSGQVNEDAPPNTTIYPAPQFGAYLCDTPLALAAASLQAIPVLAGVEKTGFNFTIYTGDLVSHDPSNELSRAYTLYTETLVFDLFKKLLGPFPVYAALGNHDSYNSAQDAPHSLGGELGEQFSWNYDHVAHLWEHYDWLPKSSVDLARAHYGGYMVRRQDGLRVITLNTDFWYKDNIFNMTDPDVSGMLRFLTDELHDAEDAGDRVWILGHVLSGWTGSDALDNPSNLFYQIIDRFSPHVIANIYWGHTHQDHFSIFYANNGSVMNSSTAQTVSWIGPSITPLTNLNSGFRVYEVDSATFDILESYTWISDVSTYPALDKQTPGDNNNHNFNFTGPVYELEYSARELYGKFINGWGEDDPLNATWWHKVTEAMEENPALVDTFNLLQGKLAREFTTNCTSEECVEAKICYMKSGSSPLAHRCIPGFGANV